jgi:hypothetical protein
MISKYYTHLILNNKFNTEEFKSFFSPCKSKTRTDHDKKCKKSQFRLDVNKYDISNRYINLWNSLPNDIVKSPSVYVFISRLRKSKLSEAYIRGHASV